MPFPHTPRAVYRKNPLVEVICQLRFPAVLAIAAESPYKFQEKVRQSYPVYEKVEDALGFPKALATILAQLPMQPPGEPLRHNFLTEDRTRFISLTQEFISVTTTAYERWESLREAMRLAEEAAREVYGPAFYTRVGLRYQDAIRKEALGLQNDRWASLISPHFAGLLAADAVQDEVRLSQSITVLQLAEVKGALVHIRHGLANLPPAKELAYVIDTDFYTQERCTGEQAFATLDTFNQLGGDLFRWAITPRLSTALEPEPVD